jgi:hypothetical protein
MAHDAAAGVEAKPPAKSHPAGSAGAAPRGSLSSPPGGASELNADRRHGRSAASKPSSPLESPTARRPRRARSIARAACPAAGAARGKFGNRHRRVPADDTRSFRRAGSVRRRWLPARNCSRFRLWPANRPAAEPAGALANGARTSLGRRSVDLAPAPSKPDPQIIGFGVFFSDRPSVTPIRIKYFSRKSSKEVMQATKTSL